MNRLAPMEDTEDTEVKSHKTYLCVPRVLRGS